MGSQGASTIPGPDLAGWRQTIQLARRPIPFLQACRAAHGDVFRLRILGRRYVALAHPDLVRELFRGDPRALHAGEHTAFTLGPMIGRGTPTLDEQPHLRQRRLVVPHFRGAGLRRLEASMVRAAEEMVQAWPDRGAFDLGPAVMEATRRVVGRTVWGRPPTDAADALERIGGALMSYGRATRALQIPALRRNWGRLSPWGRFLRMRQRFDALVMGEIRRRRTAPDPEDPSVLAALLACRDETGRPLEDAAVRDEIVGLWVAGHDTTGMMLSWVFERTLRHPTVHAIAEREAREASLDPDATGGATAGLTYADAVVRETLRQLPLHPWIIARVVRCPFVVDGFLVPPGDCVGALPHVIHSDPAVHPEPGRFLPERFLERRTDPCTWLPFGGGARRCVGESFAMTQMKIVFASVLRSCDLALAGRVRPLRRGSGIFAPPASLPVHRLARRPGRVRARSIGKRPRRDSSQGGVSTSFRPAGRVAESGSGR